MSTLGGGDVTRRTDALDRSTGEDNLLQIARSCSSCCMGRVPAPSAAPSAASKQVSWVSKAQSLVGSWVRVVSKYSSTAHGLSGPSSPLPLARQVVANVVATMVGEVLCSFYVRTGTPCARMTEVQNQRVSDWARMTSSSSYAETQSLQRTIDVVALHTIKARPYWATNRQDMAQSGRDGLSRHEEKRTSEPDWESWLSMKRGMVWNPGARGREFRH